MRIAIIIEHVNRRGGQERVVAELAERLSRYHEVHLFCFSADDLQGERLTVHLMWCPSRSSTLQAVWVLLASLVCLRDPHFDAVMSQGGNSFRQNFVLLHNAHALRMHGVRNVEWHYHPPSLPRRVFLWLRARFFLHFEARAVRRCRGRVMTVSHFLKEYCLRQHHLADEEVHVTPNGVDHDVFHPGLRDLYREVVREELDIPQDAFVILYVGGRWFEKGVPLLVEALGQMENRDAHLVIVGSGDTGFFSRLAARHDVADRVRFVPPTAEPQRYYGMGDCFGFPSPAEPFGLVLAEAAAVGQALVATRAGAVEYLIEDGASGFIVPMDSEIIASRFDTLSGDRELLERMKKNAHEKSLGLSWDTQMQQVMAVLEREVEGRGHGDEAVPARTAQQKREAADREGVRA